MAYEQTNILGKGLWLLGLAADAKPLLPAWYATLKLMETDTGRVFQWTGDRWLPAERVHPVTDALITTTALKGKVLSGDVFTATHRQTVADGAALEAVIETPSDPLDIYMQSFSLKTTDGDIDIEVYEDCTLLTPGTDIPIINLNRISSKLPQLTSFKHGAGQALPDGDLIFPDWIPPTGSSGNKNIGTKGEFLAEWILKNNANYYIVITNNSGSAIDIQASWLWHEALSPLF